MNIIRQLFGVFKERAPQKFHCAFTGDPDELRKLCGAFPAADALYWQYVTQGGFAVYDGALRFFSVCAEPDARNVIEWNRRETWKFAYQDLLPSPLWCFAEDVFGNQFCFKEDGVFMLDAETGSLEQLAATFTEWKELVASDADYYSGRNLASAWNDTNFPLTPAKVLMPEKPFIAGGEYDISNLFMVNAAEAMRLRGDIAWQIKDLPDGSEIRIRFR